MKYVTRLLALFLLRHGFGSKAIEIYPRPDGMSTVWFGRSLFGSKEADLIRTHDLSRPGSYFGIPRGYRPLILNSGLGGPILGFCGFESHPCYEVS